MSGWVPKCRRSSGVSSDEYTERHRRINGVLCVPNPRYEGLWMEAQGEYKGISAETLNAAYRRVCELMPHGYCGLAANGGVLILSAQWYFIQLQHLVKGGTLSVAEEFRIPTENVMKNARKLN